MQFFHINSLIISVKTSDTLTNISLHNDKFSFTHFLLSLLRGDEEFWPILVEFNQARYFDFESVLINLFSRHIECPELLGIVSHPEFPIFELITGRVLIECSDCFNKLTLETLKRAQNPLDFVNFESKYWVYEQNVFFIDSDDPPLHHKWSNVCKDWDLLERVIDTEDTEVANMIFDSISIGCFKKLTVSSTLNLLTRLEDDISNQNFIIEVSRPPQSVLSRLFSFSFLSPIADQEEDFVYSSSLKILKRTVTILSLTITNLHVSEIYAKGWDILTKHLNRLKANHRIVFRNKLIPLIEDFLNISNTNNRKLVKLVFDLIDVSSSGTWLLNLLCIGQHFGAIKEFIPPFLETFFDPSETIVSTSDIENLLKIFPIGYRVIFEFMMQKRPELIEPFYEDYSQSISQIVKSTFIPLETILSFAFKSTRKYDSLKFDVISIPAEADWISIIGCVNRLIDRRTNNYRLFSLNAIILHRQKTHNLAYLLDLFFDSILDLVRVQGIGYKSSHWWMVTDQSLGHRPTIAPSLNLPPQMMKTVGHILAAAMNANIKIPFIIDWRYFDFLFDYNDPSNNLMILKILYPNYELEFIVNSQVSQKISIYDSQISLNEMVLIQLIADGSSQLRSSLNEALQFEPSIDAKTTYSLLFFK